MESEGSLPSSKEPVTGSFPQADEWSQGLLYDRQYPSLHLGLFSAVFRARFPTDMLYTLSLVLCALPCLIPYQPLWFPHPNNIRWRVQIMNLFLTQYIVQSSVTLCLISPNVSFSNLFPKILSILRCSLRVRKCISCSFFCKCHYFGHSVLYFSSDGRSKAS
jgi:hypothetical protein